MATVESQPAVIDFDSLLTPISEENPSGEGLQYSGLYDQIREARRADDQTLSQGDWQTDTKSADFREVINLAVPALTSQTKDIQIAAWLCEALTKENGFVGMRDGLKLVRLYHENFWDTFHPVIEDGDMEGRANAVEWLEKQMALTAKMVPITAGQGASYTGWEDSKRFDFPESLDHLDSEEQEKIIALQQQAQRENRVTAEAWRKAYGQSRRAFYEDLNLAIGECVEELTALDRAIEATYDSKQMPGLNSLKKSLEDVAGLVERFLKERRLEEPDASDDAETDDDGWTKTETTASSGTGTNSGPIKSRKDALARLSQVADFFKKTEPHSPVAYLVQRAVKWGNMPLDSWLQEVVKDENTLSQLRETLGINGSSSDSWGSDSWGSEASSDPAEESSDSSW